MRAFLNLTLLAITAFMLIVSCKDDKDPVTNEITGSLVHNSNCKTFKSSDRNSEIPDSLSCVNYAYDTLNHDIIMKHINAGFNCCPGGLSCEVTTHNDTIIIRESEKEQGCNCNCLFDLDIKFQNVDPNKYIVKFIEPYAEGQEELVFEMDLTSINEGEYCVVRKGYPWGG
jgi:hypothetical protein